MLRKKLKIFHKGKIMEKNKYEVCCTSSESAFFGCELGIKRQCEFG